MNPLPDEDPPTSSDRQRRWAARAASRRAVAEARAELRRATVRAFRVELANTVRSVSPLLVGLLRSEGLQLDEVVARLSPARRWPAGSFSPGRASDPLMSPVSTVWLRHLLVSERQHGLCLPLTSGEIALISVVGHSLEVEIRGLGATLTSRFGVLRIIAPGSLPETVAATVLDMPVTTLVRHPLLNDRDWRISAIERGTAEFALVCRIGHLHYAASRG